MSMSPYKVIQLLGSILLSLLGLCVLAVGVSSGQLWGFLIAALVSLPVFLWPLNFFWSHRHDFKRVGVRGWMSMDENESKALAEAKKNRELAKKSTTEKWIDRVILYGIIVLIAYGLLKWIASNVPPYTVIVTLLAIIIVNQVTSRRY